MGDWDGVSDAWAAAESTSHVIKITHVWPRTREGRHLTNCLYITFMKLVRRHTLCVLSTYVYSVLLEVLSVVDNI